MAPTHRYGAPMAIDGRAPPLGRATPPAGNALCTRGLSWKKQQPRAASTPPTLCEHQPTLHAIFFAKIAYFYRTWSREAPGGDGAALPPAGGSRGECYWTPRGVRSP
jgi:hypothetical protein